MMNITYYGYFAEKAQKQKDFLEYNDISIQDLYDILKNKYQFDLELDDVLISINGAYINDMTCLIHIGDTICVLPPMSGG